jgi:dTDP-4-dehydrorhamnose reductase
MRILITGGNGQLGRALQAALTSDQVDALGHSDLDITSREQVFRTLSRLEPDSVIHAAAWTDTAGCERDTDLAMRVNSDGAAIVAEACREIGSALLYISSNEVFDGEKPTPYVEADQPNPINAYGRSKLEGERRVQAVFDRSCIVRTSWLYGPGRDSFPEKILGAARRGGPLKLVTDEIASPTFTVDLAQGVARLVRERETGLFHLTNTGACSRREWAEEVLRLAGVSVAIEPVTQAEYGGPFRKPVNSVLENRNAAQLGVTLRPWQEALAEHVQSAISQAVLS